MAGEMREQQEVKRMCFITHKDKNCNFPWMTAHGVSAKVLRSQLRLWLNRSSAGRAKERPRLRWNRKEQAAYRRASAVALRPADADEDDDTPSWMRTDDRGGAAPLPPPPGEQQQSEISQSARTIDETRRLLACSHVERWFNLRNLLQDPQLLCAITLGGGWLRAEGLCALPKLQLLETRPSQLVAALEDSDIVVTSLHAPGTRDMGTQATRDQRHDERRRGGGAGGGMMLRDPEWHVRPHSIGTLLNHDNLPDLDNLNQHRNEVIKNEGINTLLNLDKLLDQHRKQINRPLCRTVTSRALLASDSKGASRGACAAIDAAFPKMPIADADGWPLMRALSSRTVDAASESAGRLNDGRLSPSGLSGLPIARDAGRDVEAVTAIEAALVEARELVREKKARSDQLVGRGGQADGLRSGAAVGLSLSGLEGGGRGTLQLATDAHVHTIALHSLSPLEALIKDGSVRKVCFGQLSLLTSRLSTAPLGMEYDLGRLRLPPSTRKGKASSLRLPQPTRNNRPSVDESIRFEGPEDFSLNLLCERWLGQRLLRGARAQKRMGQRAQAALLLFRALSVSAEGRELLRQSTVEALPASNASRELADHLGVDLERGRSMPPAALYDAAVRTRLLSHAAAWELYHAITDYPRSEHLTVPNRDLRFSM